MKLRMLATGVAVTSLTGLAGLAYATPANAASQCATTSKEFPTSGFNADVKVQLCIARNWGGPGGSNSYTWAYANVSWGDSGAGKFENFDVQVRIEQNDSVVKSGTCDITSKINTGSGSTTCRIPGSGSYLNISGNTADGKVTYNVNDDGLGNQPWELAGTPKI
ncbi:hypothetical protein SMC26_18595 [Actinomadura fulvescens]|uniref:Secreted protein n=1 Tax=Actinomadura fulvescens TaxID=46160 RepID=A0ABN3QFB4_9ACTN